MSRLRTELPPVAACAVALALLSLPSPAGATSHGRFSGHAFSLGGHRPKTAVELIVKGNRIRIASFALRLRCDPEPTVTVKKTISTPFHGLYRGGGFRFSKVLGLKLGKRRQRTKVTFQGAVRGGRLRGNFSAEPAGHTYQLERCLDGDTFTASRG